jgi:hypothetical protein
MKSLGARALQGLFWRCCSRVLSKGHIWEWFSGFELSWPIAGQWCLFLAAVHQNGCSFFLFFVDCSFYHFLSSHGWKMLFWAVVEGSYMGWKGVIFRFWAVMADCGPMRLIPRGYPPEWVFVFFFFEICSFYHFLSSHGRFKVEEKREKWVFLLFLAVLGP